MEGEKKTSRKNEEKWLEAGQKDEQSEGASRVYNNHHMGKNS